MRQLLAGLALGTVLGSGGAIAGVRDLVAGPGSRVTVQPGRQYSTALTFPGLDLSCTYSITRGAFELEPARSALLFCSRKSVPGSLDPKQPQSRLVIVSRFRYYVTDNYGRVAYKALRAP
jgi:hypothetical protein